MAAAVALPGIAAAQAAADISGVWTLIGYRSTVRPAVERIPLTLDGQMPPLQPWAAALYKERRDDSDNGRPFAGTSAHCLPSGMPLMMMAANYPIQILQTPGQVTMIFEEQSVHRFIYLNEAHAIDPDPGYMGNSVGHWEDDTLVVDTIGLIDTTTIDLTGMPHSPSLHLVERIRKISPDILEDLITIDDPKTFTKSWTTRTTYRLSKERPQEYFCAENNRNEPTADNHPTFKRK